MATIKDIAKAAGVSVATISYVFNGKGSVSEETKQKIFDIARELKYKPRTIHSNTLTVAVVAGVDYMGELTSPYSATLLAHLSRCMSERDVIMEMITVKNSKRIDFSIFNGAISLLHDSESVSEFKSYAGASTPLVCISWQGSPEDHVVGYEVGLGIEKGVNYLHEKGHDRIGILCSSADPMSQTTRQRLECYERSIGNLKLEFDPDLTQFTNVKDPCDPQPVKALLEAGCTSILVDGEYFGGVLCNILHKLGKKIPEDVSILPYENAFLSKFAMPPHTTISQPLEKVAETAVDTVLGLIDGKIEKRVSVRYDCEIIERESVKKLN
ncbi:MAG: LacI family DNA-binding transcriptional regulator [Planctomycetota bacterium]|jgi:DNA-binding LacI/PurR family transcriptional regulator